LTERSEIISVVDKRITVLSHLYRRVLTNFADRIKESDSQCSKNWEISSTL